MVINICILYSSLGNLISEQGEISVCLDVQNRLPEGGGSESCIVCFTIVWLCALHTLLVPFKARDILMYNQEHWALA